jgi:uracil-DNA glycosylase
MLYGSALANLLRKDERGSGTLPALSDPRIKEFISKVLRFTVSHMPNLQAIACLGKVAWDCVTETYNQRDANWNEYRNAPEPLQVEHLKIFALAHPAYTHGGIEKVNNDWKKLRENFEASGSKR